MVNEARSTTMAHSKVLLCQVCGTAIDTASTKSNLPASAALVEEVSRQGATSGQGYIKQAYNQHRRHRSPLQVHDDLHWTENTYSETTSHVSPVPSLISAKTPLSSRSISTPVFSQNGQNNCGPVSSTTVSPITSVAADTSRKSVGRTRVEVMPDACSPATILATRLPQVSARNSDGLTSPIRRPSWLKTPVDTVNDAMYEEHLRRLHQDQMDEVETEPPVLRTVATSPHANTWSDLTRTRHIYAQKELPPIPKSPKRSIQRPRTAGAYRPFPKVDVVRKSCDTSECQSQPSQPQVFSTSETRHASVDQIAHRRFQRWVRRVLW